MTQQIQKQVRISSIDIVRGIVMVLMVLDHTRATFTGDALSLFGSASTLISEVTNISVTTPFLYVMRWVSHICAPSFVFLAGVSIFFWNKKYGDSKSLVKHFVSRGLLLIALEFALAGRAFFSEYGYITVGVLWAIGMSMILFPLALKLSTKIQLALIFIITITANLIPLQHVDSLPDIIKLLLARGDLSSLSTTHLTVFVGYPILPWFAVMLLGYVFAKVFTLESAKQRQKILLYTSACFFVVFAFLRITNVFGDSIEFITYNTVWQNIASFINVTKYPPSLQYLLITLSITFALLALVEYLDYKPKMLLVFGTTPLFFYWTHLVGIQVVSFIIQKISTIIPMLAKLSFTPLGVVVYTILIVLVLYPICTVYKEFMKKVHKARKSS